jgi:hypothetical protein
MQLSFMTVDVFTVRWLGASRLAVVLKTAAVERDRFIPTNREAGSARRRIRVRI